jgi:hypothetical protein
MKIDEIGIGSWVRYGRRHYLIDEIMLIDILEYYRLTGKIEYKPIKLSDTWMSSFGFQSAYYYGDSIEYRFVYGDDPLIDVMTMRRKIGINKFELFYLNKYLPNIKYVHELQNKFKLGRGNNLVRLTHNKNQYNHIRQINCTINLDNKKRIK